MRKLVGIDEFKKQANLSAQNLFHDNRYPIYDNYYNTS
jgi:hypothetical protein